MSCMYRGHRHLGSQGGRGVRHGRVWDRRCGDLCRTLGDSKRCREPGGPGVQLGAPFSHAAAWQMDIDGESEMAWYGRGAAVLRRRGGGTTLVAKRRLEVAAEAVRGSEMARGEEEKRSFRESKTFGGARRNQSILTDASADDPDLENGLESLTT